MKTVEELIDDVRTAAAALGNARRDEMRMEAARAIAKRDAVLRLMQTENPLTHKPHSASSAEAVVETDPAYAEFLSVQRAGVVTTQVAWGHYEAAKLAAQLEVNLATIPPEAR